MVPQFAGPNEVTMGAQIAAGPSNSVVIDKQQMYWMAGKWKTTGDGSSGQPYSSFRYVQDIMACKVTHINCGGVTHWALAPDEDGSVMTIAFGQGAANGELGLGPDEPKSATKPTRNTPLIGIEVFQVAAGHNTTFFLAVPNEKFSDLPRHPIDLEGPELCVICSRDTGDDDSPLECDKCDYPYHLGCLDPPLDAVPDGEWFCPDCVDEPGAPVEIGGKRKPRKAGSKPKPAAAPVQEEEADEEEGVDDGDDSAPKGHKRKASTSSKAPAKRKK